jgi:hypothetical protein
MSIAVSNNSLCSLSSGSADAEAALGTPACGCTASASGPWRSAHIAGRLGSAESLAGLATRLRQRLRREPFGTVGD